MLVQPQQAATVCELDPVQHTIGSSKRAQTLDPNQPPENSYDPLNLTLDLEYAHVSGHPHSLRSRQHLRGQGDRNGASTACPSGALALSTGFERSSASQIPWRRLGFRSSIRDGTSALAFSGVSTSPACRKPTRKLFGIAVNELAANADAEGRPVFRTLRRSFPHDPRRRCRFASAPRRRRSGSEALPGDPRPRSGCRHDYPRGSAIGAADLHNSV